MTMEQTYCVLKKYKHLLNYTARSFIWLYDTYIQSFQTYGSRSPHTLSWMRLAEQACEDRLVQSLCEKLLQLEVVGAYLNDDGKHDCSRCKLRDCRWRGRDKRHIHCIKNSAGTWMDRSPKVI